MCVCQLGLALALVIALMTYLLPFIIEYLSRLSRLFISSAVQLSLRISLNFFVSPRFFCCRVVLLKHTVLVQNCW